MVTNKNIFQSVIIIPNSISGGDEPPDGRKTPHTEVPRSSPETGPKGFGEWEPHNKSQPIKGGSPSIVELFLNC